MDIKKIFFSLFSFDRFLVWNLFKFVHAGIQTLVFLAILGYSFEKGWIILLSPVAFLFIRLMFEFMGVMFSINNKLGEIKDLLKETNKKEGN